MKTRPFRRRIFCWLVLGALAFTTAGCNFPLVTTQAAQPTPSKLVPSPINSETAVPSETATIPPSPMPAFTVPPSETPIPTLTASLEPSATVTSSPIPPTDTPVILRTSTATRWWYRSPTMTPTPKPSYPSLMIDVPGPLSRINTPLHIEAGAIPGEDGMVYLDVTAEDGTSLQHHVVNFTASRYIHNYFYHNIDFKLDVAAELVRIQLSTRDRFNRLMAVAATDVILIQMGSDQMNASVITLEPFFVQNLRKDQVITGGYLQVSGVVRPVNTAPVKFDLINEQGAVVGSASLDVLLVDSKQPYEDFNLFIPYTVKSDTAVRLTIYQESDNRLPGIMALNSMTLILKP